MDEGYQWLKGAAERMKSDVAKGAAPKPERLTVRQLLRRFGYQMRGEAINNHIRNGLEQFELRTDEDFTIAWIDAEITIELDSAAGDAAHRPRTPDPTLRVATLDAANRKPTSVKPESPLKEATTRMLLNDYSQLPVMRNDRDVAGVISWESIGARLTLGGECTQVRQCTKPAEVIPSDTRLFDAIRRVSEHGYVLVRGRERTITGIVTATDFSELLGRLAGPFLFVGEIESHLRNLIHGKFTRDQLRAAAGDERTVEGSADLTFGEYRRLLENKENWERLELDIDRREFVTNLDIIRRIRNEIMHFRPDGLSDDDRQVIRKAARFFDKLAAIFA